MAFRWPSSAHDSHPTRSYPVLPSRTSPALSFGKGALGAPGAKAAASSAKLRLAPLRVRCGSISNCPKNKENVHLHHLGIKILVPPQKKSGSGDSFDVEQDVQNIRIGKRVFPSNLLRLCRGGKLLWIDKGLV